MEEYQGPSRRRCLMVLRSALWFLIVCMQRGRCPSPKLACGQAHLDNQPLRSTIKHHEALSSTIKHNAKERYGS